MKGSRFEMISKHLNRAVLNTYESSFMTDMDRIFQEKGAVFSVNQAKKIEEIWRINNGGERDRFETRTHN